MQPSNELFYHDSFEPKLLIHVGLFLMKNSFVNPLSRKSFFSRTHSAWAGEYVYCISVEGLDTLNEYPGYDTKLHRMIQKLWGMWNIFILTWSGNSCYRPIYGLNRMV